MLSGDVLERMIMYGRQYDRVYVWPIHVSRKQIEIERVEESNGNYHNKARIHSSEEECEKSKLAKKTQEE